MTMPRVTAIPINDREELRVVQSSGVVVVRLFGRLSTADELVGGPQRLIFPARVGVVLARILAASS